MGRIILFAKRPQAGRVKTRLSPPLRPEDALLLYRAFLVDGLAFLASFPGKRFQAECSSADPWPPAEAASELGVAVDGIEFSVQRPGDLGERMFQAFLCSRSAGAGSTVILGADSPTLPRQFVLDAFGELEAGADAVISPSGDGGDVLIGWREPSPELFQGRPWGGDQVSDATRRAAKKHGLDLRETEPWFDVDRAEDLPRLLRDLDTAEGLRRAPATARACSLLFPSGTGSLPLDR